MSQLGIELFWNTRYNFLNDIHHTFRNCAFLVFMSAYKLYSQHSVYF